VWRVKPVNEAGTWYKTPWHYPCTGYRGHLLGLFVETDDENVARREVKMSAAVFCTDGKVLDVKKVVIQ
jgi:hypothetical protein